MYAYKFAVGSLSSAANRFGTCFAAVYKNELFGEILRKLLKRLSVAAYYDNGGNGRGLREGGKHPREDRDSAEGDERL